MIYSQSALNGLCRYSGLKIISYLLSYDKEGKIFENIENILAIGHLLWETMYIRELNQLSRMLPNGTRIDRKI